MNKRFVIGWKSKSSDRSGRGQNLFSREEAESMAAELNRDYPAFEHYPVEAEEQAADIALEQSVELPVAAAA